MVCADEITVITAPNLIGEVRVRERETAIKKIIVREEINRERKREIKTYAIHFPPLMTPHSIFTVMGIWP